MDIRYKADKYGVLTIGVYGIDPDEPIMVIRVTNLRPTDYFDYEWLHQLSESIINRMMEGQNELNSTRQETSQEATTIAI